MNFLDILIALIIGFNIFMGMRKGALNIISGLLGLVISFSFAKKYFTAFNPLIDYFFTLENTYKHISSFTIVMILCYIIFNIGVYILNKLLKFSGAGLFNHILGAFLGFIKGTIIVLLITIPIILYDSDMANTSKILYDSRPFLDLLIINLEKSHYFKTILENLEIPLSHMSKITT